MWHLLCLLWRLGLQSCDGWWWMPADSSSPEGHLCRAAVQLVVLHTTPHLLKGWTWGRYTEIVIKTVGQINTWNLRFPLDCPKSCLFDMCIYRSRFIYTALFYYLKKNLPLYLLQMLCFFTKVNSQFPVTWSLHFYLQKIKIYWFIHYSFHTGNTTFHGLRYLEGEKYCSPTLPV